MEEIETTIYTEEGIRIGIDEWDDGGVWLSLRANSASMYTTINRSDAEKLLVGLQKILSKEVV